MPRAAATIKDEAELSFLAFFASFGGVEREMLSKQRRKQELTTSQAILKLTGVSHYVVQFECDKCISVIPRKLLLNPPEPARIGVQASEVLPPDRGDEQGKDVVLGPSDDE